MSALFTLLMLTSCVTAQAPANAESTDGATVAAAFSETLLEIPQSYSTEAEVQGTLAELEYDTWESMTYDRRQTALTKRAIVYLPSGYSEDRQYNVLYLMHGGWSDETTYLGTPDAPAVFKNVLDHAIENGDIAPLIVVCPTYNNTSGEDSGDYSLALRLTDNYHNELMNDLLPAVARAYSTFAEDATPEGLRASRDHRAFAGFSMGAVATWHTFEYCLDSFRYFLPSSGSLTSGGDYMASIVRDSRHDWDDFFIFAASGTDDFAYSSFKSQIEAMAAVEDSTFRIANSDAGGNLYYLEKEGGTHSGKYAMQYIYTGVCGLWQGSGGAAADDAPYTANSTVADVLNDPQFGGFGRLLFPVDRTVTEDMTLTEVSTDSVYLWYSDIQPEKTVEILNTLHRQAAAEEPVFYSIYTEEEIAADPRLGDTGLFFFRGIPGREFAITNAGGGFYYVGAMHDSFPHAREVSKAGYNAFALIYRPDDPYTDLARAITFIHDHAQELQVNPVNYSLWGGSAGARMAATLGNADYLYQLTGRKDIPQAAAVVMQYTGYTNISAQDAPTYVCVGTSDGIAGWRTMQNRLSGLSALGITTEFHAYEGLGHGFGLGTGTAAEGWPNDAIAFWEQQMKE